MSFPTGEPLGLPPTELRNPATLSLDTLPSLEILQCLNAEDALVAAAVAVALPALAHAVDEAVRRIRDGGRIHYFGAGTSGRIATLDAAELPPTFGSPAHWCIAHIAGGERALKAAVEAAEDNAESGAHDAREVSAADLVVGITSSGRTPYVRGALSAAREAGAYTALVANDPASPLRSLADCFIVAATGPEALTGSTRLKAGTSAKLLLNGFSTAVMIGLGRTYSNLMVDLVPTNEKLRDRTLRILVAATGQGEAACRAALHSAGGEVKTALLMLLTGQPAAEAARLLAASAGSVRLAASGSPT